jgi:hypothetical protein
MAARLLKKRSSINRSSSGRRVVSFPRKSGLPRRGRGKGAARVRSAERGIGSKGRSGGSCVGAAQESAQLRPPPCVASPAFASGQIDAGRAFAAQTAQQKAGQSRRPLPRPTEDVIHQKQRSEQRRPTTSLCQAISQEALPLRASAVSGKQALWTQFGDQ